MCKYKYVNIIFAHKFFETHYFTIIKYLLILFGLYFNDKILKYLELIY
jgi:hypothetical protein